MDSLRPSIVHRPCSGVSDRDEDDGFGDKVLALRGRIRHFTWTWFCMTMATGGMANVLYTIPEPFRFKAVYGLGCAFFILNILLFIFNICMISLRFYLYPSTFKASFLHPTESLFIPAAVISFGTILNNITQYGVGAKTGVWLESAMYGFYWFYCCLAVLFSCGIYLTLWSTQTFTISQMTPVWIFPAYPLLIVGPFAGNLAQKMISSPQRTVSVIVGGYVLQGVGFMVALMIYSAFLYRLMTQKLPKESLRPAMFISVGPSGFTICGIITMAHELPRVVSPNFMGEGMGEFAGKVSVVMANWMGLWLWGLALWFFFVSVGAHWSCATRGRMDFAMTWFSFVFPNTALTTATFAISQALGHSYSIALVGCIMTVALVILWFFVCGMMIRAVLLKQILWPQKQEDRDEGGWGKDSKARVGEAKSPGWSRLNVILGGMHDTERGEGPGPLKRRGSWRSAAKKGQKRDADTSARDGNVGQLHGEPEHEGIEKMNPDDNAD
ncbi:hypothetical protein EJ06DRAFT_480552 [Trichodelitschia bisporula]|uniref:C4-dicarboxylate/malic acid transporter n=1 Tax=Trichodelitschia bisporula TaxID=703511 RepID=A0A6G1HQR1_9PEZI|nr:hypothetical protein EJ06DRAFT_480552 [Trichodelitschia bisporula]